LITLWLLVEAVVVELKPQMVLDTQEVVVQVDLELAQDFL
tara:strand:+ start:558 stop:677 length:120 start_codon:yes stop_codon:yes gene_type:complete